MYMLYVSFKYCRVISEYYLFSKFYVRCILGEVLFFIFLSISFLLFYYYLIIILNCVEFILGYNY